MTQYFHTVLNIEQVKQLGADFGIKGDASQASEGIVHEVQLRYYDGAFHAQVVRGARIVPLEVYRETMTMPRPAGFA